VNKDDCLYYNWPNKYQQTTTNKHPTLNRNRTKVVLTDIRQTDNKGVLQYIQRRILVIRLLSGALHTRKLVSRSDKLMSWCSCWYSLPCSFRPTCPVFACRQVDRQTPTHFRLTSFARQSSPSGQVHCEGVSGSIPVNGRKWRCSRQRSAPLGWCSLPTRPRGFTAGDLFTPSWPMFYTLAAFLEA